MKVSLVILFTLFFRLGFSQDTIALTKNKHNAYLTGDGFTLICEEANFGISIDKTTKKGHYILTHHGGVIAKVNFISFKEYLVYYYSSDAYPIITRIEYYPYFKISLDVVNSQYQIASMESYKKANYMEFQLSKEQCYIGILDKKKHKKKKIILDLEFIN